MKERPILFSGPMVKAILEGRKTQTRRVVSKHVNDLFFAYEKDDGWHIGDDPNYESVWRCPYGNPLDRLWVRETHYVWKAGSNDGTGREVRYRATEPDDPNGGWSPSIFMPRWASRLTLEIVNVRVERLQEIVLSFDDLQAEGVIYDADEPNIGPCDGDITLNMAERFGKGWDALNAKRGYSWESNPWVWVIEFRRIDGERKASGRERLADALECPMVAHEEKDLVSPSKGSSTTPVL